MRKFLVLLTTMLLLSGCAESVAFLSSSISGASSGKMLQSSLNSAVSYGVKHKTGKSPLEHAKAYAEKVNPESKKEKCISFIESTRSEFCKIAKEQISLTNFAVKEKALKIAKKYPQPNKIKDMTLKIENNLMNNFFQTKKSPRELAIVFQSKIKKNKASWPQLNKLRP